MIHLGLTYLLITCESMSDSLYEYQDGFFMYMYIVFCSIKATAPQWIAYNIVRKHVHMEMIRNERQESGSMMQSTKEENFKV